VRDGGVVDMNLGDACRGRLDLRRGRFEAHALSDAKCEFPTTHPGGGGGPRRYVWLTITAGGAPGIARLDLERAAEARWCAPPGHHPSEPVFVPRPGGSGETDGWVLVLVYDEATETSHVAVLDA